MIKWALRHLAPEDVGRLVSALHGKVLPLSRDHQGNHVIQRSIEAAGSLAAKAARDGDLAEAEGSADRMQHIIDDVVTDVELLSRHRYGCRIVQRAIEHGFGPQREAVLVAVLSRRRRFVTDACGKYVMQRVLACGSDSQRAAVLERLTEQGAVLSLSRHKHGSTVVEAALRHCEGRQREALLEALLQVSRKCLAETKLCVFARFARSVRVRQHIPTIERVHFCCPCSRLRMPEERRKDVAV